VRVAIRPAAAADVPALVEVYDHAYRGGYSACLDRYGPARLEDFWWVQAEKSVHLIEVDRRPAGVIVVGRAARQALAEEVLVRPPRELRGSEPHTLLQSIHAFLVRLFQQERQDRLTVRCAETNAWALTLVHRFGFTLASVLVVASGMDPRRDDPPDGYVLRRATAEDAAAIRRVCAEVFPAVALPAEPPRGAVWGVLAERQSVPVGVGLLRADGPVARWTVGVREGHRRRGVGSALAREVAALARERRLVPLTTYWALDVAAAEFVRQLGVRTERAYLYFERPL
jgi:ribosomal protein S18 acetylase RimI-like enzyme